MFIVNLIQSIIGLTLWGAFFAIPIAIPPLRRRGRQNPRFRIGVILVCSLLPSILLLSFLLYIGPTLSVVFNYVGCPGYDGFNECPNYPVEYELSGKLGHEIGLRNLLPPPFRYHCFTGISEVCEAADNSEYLTTTTWFNYLMGWLFSSLLGAPTAIIGWYLTRPVQKEKRKNVE